MVGPVSGPLFSRYRRSMHSKFERLRGASIRCERLVPGKEGALGRSDSGERSKPQRGQASITLGNRKPQGREKGFAPVRVAEWCSRASRPACSTELTNRYGQLSVAIEAIMASTASSAQTGPRRKEQRRRHDGRRAVGATISSDGPTGDMRTFGTWTDGVANDSLSRASGRASSPNRTCEGCYIGEGLLYRWAQSEAGVQFMMPAYYEFAANGKIPQRRGSRAPSLRSPEGVRDVLATIDGSPSARGFSDWEALRAIIGGACEIAICFEARPASQSGRDNSSDRRSDGRQESTRSSRCCNQPESRRTSSVALEPHRDTDPHHLVPFKKKFTDAVSVRLRSRGRRLCVLDRTAVAGYAAASAHRWSILRTFRDRLHLSGGDRALTEAGARLTAQGEKPGHQHSRF